MLHDINNDDDDGNFFIIHHINNNKKYIILYNSNYLLINYITCIALLFVTFFHLIAIFTK